MLPAISLIAACILGVGAAAAVPEGSVAPDFDPRSPEAYSKPFPEPEPAAPPAAEEFEGWDAIRSATLSALDEVEPAGEEPGPEGPVDPARRPFFDQLLNALSALLVVLALIVGVYVFLRRFGRRGPLAGAQPAIRHRGKFALDGRAALHTVEVGGKILVLGVTAQNVNLLATFTPEELGAEPAGVAPGPTDFLAHLRASGAPTPTAATGESEDAELDSLRREIERLQRHLREGSSGRD